MASQPSDREDGDDGELGEKAGSRKAAAGLDAELDRAVPGAEAEAFLIGVGGKEAGRVYALSFNTVLLGRTPEADIFLTDPSVSAEHARIINGSQGFEIEDLGSTNGTFVNGARVTRAHLSNGERVTLGQVDFNFLFDRSVDTTIAVFSPNVRPSVTSGGGALVKAPAPYFPQSPRQAFPPAANRGEEEGPSLADTIGRLIKAYRFIRPYFRMIAALVAVGMVLGILSVVVVPPASQAFCEVKLQPQLKSNPVDPQQQRSDNPEDTVQFFAGAERAFTVPDLVASTVKKVEGRDPSDAEVDSIVGRLKFEPLPDHIYRATYKGRAFGGGRTNPAQFLKAHLNNYVQTEISKALRVFTAQADFLRDQMKSVEKEMGTISAERTKFREENSDRLPEEAALAQTSRYALETHRAELVGQIRRLQGELDANRSALRAEGPVAQTRFHSSQVYRDSLAAINQKLSEAYARGLADGHPEVKQLKDEKARVEGLIEKEMHTDTNQLDRQSNAGLQDLKSRVDLLQAQLSAARSDLGDTDRSLGQARHVVGDLPRVEEKVQQLNHTQEATTHLHGQLFEQLKKAELQLSLERVSTESRYEIVVPPQLERVGKAKSWVLRGGIGLLAGLFLAAAVIAFLEGRRLVTQTLATIDNDYAPPPPWR